MGVIDALVFKGRCYAAMAQMPGTRSVGECLTKLLIHLADLYGVEADCGVKLDFGMSQEDLAHIIGGARQSVTIGFQRLSARGLVIVDARLAAPAAFPDMARDKIPDGDNRTFCVSVRNEHGRIIYKATMSLKGEWCAA